MTEDEIFAEINQISEINLAYLLNSLMDEPVCDDLFFDDETTIFE